MGGSPAPVGGAGGAPPGQPADAPVDAPANDGAEPDRLVPETPDAGSGAPDGGTGPDGAATPCNAEQLQCYPGQPQQKCVARTRGFETGTNEGFYFFNSRTGQADYNVRQNSTARVHTGGRSLAYQMTDTASFEWILRLCDDPMGKGLDLRGKTLTFWFYLDTPGVPAAFAHIWARVGNTSDVYDEVLVSRLWTRVSTKLDDVPDNATDFIALQFTGGRDVTDAAGATFYLDDVTIE